jgi:hypothetical protein
MAATATIAGGDGGDGGDGGQWVVDGDSSDSGRLAAGTNRDDGGDSDGGWRQAEAKGDSGRRAASCVCQQRQRRKRQ